MIRLENATKSFFSKGQEICAVKDATLHIPKGSLVYVTGNNGAGKTTLMLLMSGLLSPSRGRVYIDGQDVSLLPERFIINIRRKKIGMIFQERFLLPNASVLENLVLPIIPSDLNAKTIKKKADELLNTFGLVKKNKIPCRHLSGGEKQRLIIARALINDPDIIFADEPATHLDKDIMSFLLKQVNTWHQSNKTVVVATHQPTLFTQDLKTDHPHIHFHLNKGHISEHPA